jgi:TRAP-type C4-dicarboxylate transport system substrate-binding protein
MRSGIYDVVTLRLGQVSRDEPTILGLDLVGMNTDYKTARANVEAFLPVLDKQMQAQHNLMMLGVWPFGPQIIFCKAAIPNGLADLKGKKIRILDGVMARFMEKVGATPVTMAFSEVAQGLRLGTIDCGVTGPSSANSAGWMDSATHVYSLGLQVAVQGYAISVASWKKLSPAQQAGLKAQFEKLTDEAWKKSEELWSDGIRCSTGQSPCTDHKPFKAVLVQPSARDIDLVKAAVREISLPAWAEGCDKANPGCSAGWKKTVGSLMGIQ